MKIGIDIGGSHIGVGLVNGAKIVSKKEIDLRKEDKENVKKIIPKLIKETIQKLLFENKMQITNIEYIGIAFPASLRNNQIGMSVNLGLNGFEIRSDLEEYFKIPVYIRNDAKCAALYEKKYGSLQTFSNAIFLTIGTGIGGAAFYNGDLLGTAQNDLFKIGHISINKDGPICKCKRKGCFENYASIRALKTIIRKEYCIENDITGLELRNLIKEHVQEENMQKILNEYVDNLCIGMSTITNLFEPDAIAIGGSFAHYKDIFLEKLRKKLEENKQKFHDSCPEILLAYAKNDAGIIGASIIMDEEEKDG